MNKHIGYELIWLKMRRFNIIKAKQFFKIDPIVTQGYRCQEKKAINDQQVFNDWRKKCKTGRTILIAHAGLLI